MENDITKPGNLVRHLKLVAVIASGIAIVWLGLTYWQARKEISQLKDPSIAAHNEAAQLVETIGKLMSLPEEKPTIATVEDKQKLKDQSFFKNAENGDKVLMYTGHKKAILYRPSDNKIIEVAYLSVNSKQAP